MKTKTSREKVVLVFHSSNRSAWHEMFAGITRAAAAQGWRLQTIDHDTDPKDVVELVDFWHPTGIIAECSVDEKGVFSPEVFGKVPVVYVVSDARRLDAKALRVNHDSAEFGRLAARELLSDDTRGFGYFGFKGLFWSAERGRHFEEALRLNGRGCAHFERPLNNVAPRDRDDDYRPRFIKWLRELPKPCGLLAANDMLALEAINNCAAAGLTVPDDVSVLGIDNDEVACENAQPALSSIRPDFFEAGRLAVELLAERLRRKGAFKGERLRLFPAAFVVHRASTLRLKRADASVSKAVEFIRRHACEGVQPKDVLAELDEPRRTVELHFRQLRGRSLLEEILAVRLDRVKELLADADVPINAIARKCGWRSSARLRVFFHKAEGVSMRAWRAAHAR
ncbi:MAG: substrate-binding domain-containing protein [Kiritimatiellae bacterium]|nr:substrate-binding domain-containing protein [Kiritimatiellia bacterium]